MPRKMLTGQAWELLKEELRVTGRYYNQYEHRVCSVAANVSQINYEHISTASNLISCKRITK